MRLTLILLKRNPAHWFQLHINATEEENSTIISNNNL